VGTFFFQFLNFSTLIWFSQFKESHHLVGFIRCSHPESLTCQLLPHFMELGLEYTLHHVYHVLP
jgi:hypothetical protein